MCTNRALVNSLECYMDDLVECFEDFVRNSIIIISVAVAFLVGMIAYVLKIVAERGEPTSATGGFSIPRREYQGETNRVQKQTTATGNYMTFNAQDERGTSATSYTPAADQPCYDEKILRNIGFSCSKINCDLQKCPLKTARKSIPSLPIDAETCPTPSDSKTNPKIENNLNSCCSMCCKKKCEE